MKKILIFNILALCLALHSKAQNYGYDDTYAEQSADLSSTEGFQMEAEPASAGGDAEPAVENDDANSGVKRVVRDTLMPVRKSFIRKANIIFKDRDRLRAASARLRAEIADLNQDITKKNKQVKELSDYVNNQTFAMSELKKTAQQNAEEIANMQTIMTEMNEELARTRKRLVWFTVGGVVVGIGLGVAIGIIVVGG